MTARPPTAPAVIVADDADATRNGMAALLRSRGMVPLTAADGAEAIELIKEKHVDAAVLDLQMPNTDGFAVLEYLSEHRRGLPVVLLSGLPTEQIQDRMEKLTGRQLPPLFLKPVEFDQVGEVLDLLLSGDLPTGNADHD
jgi:CheY-like chemotaxis protein